MKIIKKTLTGLLALSICASMISSDVGALQASYYKGDINSDGVINSNDYLDLLHFLNGSASASGDTAERMDLYRNYVIDYNDLEILRNILLGYSSTELVNSQNTTALPAENTVWYRKYTPSGTRVETYSLSSNTLINSTALGNSTSTYGIIGSDSRAFQDGMQGVLSVRRSDGSYLGTAFVVDSHTILTAAHVLYNYETHSVNSNLQFKVYNEYNVETNVVITPDSYHIPYEFCTSGDSNHDGKYDYIAECDYGIVTVTQDLSSYMNFNLGVMRSGNMHESVYVTGFGGSGKSNDNVNPYWVHTKTTGMGDLMEDNPYDNYFINYDADMVGGDSGGPVWVYNTTNYTKTVIGINIIETYDTDSNGNPTVNLYNTGLRLNSNILHFVYNNGHL